MRDAVLGKFPDLRNILSVEINIVAKVAKSLSVSLPQKRVEFQKGKPSERYTGELSETSVS